MQPLKAGETENEKLQFAQDESQESMISNKGKNVDRTVKFLCFSPSQLRARIDKDIEDVGSVLGVEVRNRVSSLHNIHLTFPTIARTGSDSLDAFPMEQRHSD